MVGALPEGMDVARAVGENAHDATGRNAVSREQQVRFRRLIHPVGVLKDRNLWTHLRGPQREAPQRIEDLTPTLLRVHGQHGRITRIDGEEIAQVREERPQILTEAEDTPLHLRH